MNVKSVEKEKNSAKVVVEVEKDAFEQAINKAYVKNRKSIQLPGFRKGKAPRKIIEAMFGKEVFYEDAVNEIFPDVYQQAVLGSDLKAVGTPSVADMNVADDGVLTLTVTTDLYPEVTLGQYKDLEVEKQEVQVTEQEVDARVDRMADNVARVESIEDEAALKDTAVIDYEGFRDGVPFEGGKGENFNLELGSGTFIPGFEDQVVGMKAGEEKDLNVTFPETYGEASLAGKEVVFHVKVHEVRRKTLPEKDDEFVKDVSEFDTMEELRADLKKQIAREKQAGVDRVFGDAAVELAAKNMQTEIPASMIEEELDREMNRFEQSLRQQGTKLEDYVKMLGGSVDTLRGYLRPGAENQLRVSVMLNAVVEAEQIQVTDEEVDKEYETLAGDSGMELDKIKEYVDAETLKGELEVRKARQLIIDSAIPVAPKADAPDEVPAADAPDEAPAADAAEE